MMNKVQFTAEQFTPTKWNTREDKAKFCQQFVRLVEGGFAETLFPKWFYARLSMAFGHIAHYNIVGFYDTWFSDERKQLDFLEYTARYTACGDPAWTYSDAEHVIQRWLMQSGLIEKYRAIVAGKAEASERALLAHPKQKYEEPGKGTVKLQSSLWDEIEQRLTPDAQ